MWLLWLCLLAALHSLWHVTSVVYCQDVSFKVVNCCFYSGLLLTSAGMMDKDIESLKIYIGALNVETFERAPTPLFSFAHG